ncbi:hypothetical protein AHAT_19170 [Agarivorans sp. Toyoura001]|nr:hypothetical protein AHAT_19170 [Agarivorans sp. Toyoura001]
MITTLDLLNGLKARYNLPSNYKAAKHLGITPTAVNSWHKGVSMSSKTGLRVAELLDMDVDFVHVCLLLEKAKDELEKASLERIIAKIEK